jgi:hypothetical protein
LTTLHVPYVTAHTPSDESNRSSSFSNSSSRRISSSDYYQQSSLLNPRMSVRKTVKNFFRSSKTIANMSTALINGNHLITNLSKHNRHLSRLKSSLPFINTQLSHSQPIVNENSHFDSPLIDHSEQTPLIERHSTDSKCDNNNLKIALVNTKPIRLNRQGLHLELNTDSLHRTRSCNDAIIIPLNNQETDLANGSTTLISSLQPNHSEVTSMRSSNSTASSLSAYLSSQQPIINTPLTNQHINKSQESLFSFSSPVQKQRSFKSLVMAATTQDRATKQSNDVLSLIASWVLRSPEDFQGIRKIDLRIEFI